MDVGLWLNLMLPQRQQYTQRPKTAIIAQSTFRNGVCFAFNDSQCRFLYNCRYKHECSFCADTHPASRCFKKSATPAQSRDTNAKRMNASETVRNAVLARSISRPQGQRSCCMKALSWFFWCLLLRVKVVCL